MHTTNKEYKVYELVKDQDGNTLIEETKYTGETAYNNGYSAGDSAGYTRGYNAGDSAGYTRGYNAGDSAGYTRGYNAGDSAGYTRGYNAGAAAHANDYSNGYTAGYNSRNTEVANLNNSVNYWYNVAYGWYLTADQYSSIAWLNTYYGENWAVPGQGSWPDGYGPYSGYYGY